MPPVKSIKRFLGGLLKRVIVDIFLINDPLSVNVYITINILVHSITI